MAEHGPTRGSEPQLDRWLREEVDVPAPDRLLEEVFARTETAGQVQPGWRGWLRRLRSAPGADHLGPQWPRVGLGVTAIVVVSLVGLAVVWRPGSGPGTASGTASPQPSGASLSPTPPALVVERMHTTCARGGSLVVLSGKVGVGASAWVTCGANSEEILLGTDTVTPRSGLGLIATDGSSEWAIHGDSVVRLNPDRSIAQTVRIGTPAALAVGSGTVWTLDTRTGELFSIGPEGVLRSVTPAPKGRPIAVAISGGSLWVLDQIGARLLQLDLQDGGELGSIAVAERSTILVAAAGALYVASPLTETIVRIDPAVGTATTLRPDLGPDGHIDALGGSVDGLLLGSRATVHRLDPVTARPSLGGLGPEYVAEVGLDGSRIIVLAENGLLLETALP